MSFRVSLPRRATIAQPRLPSLTQLVTNNLPPIRLGRQFPSHYSNISLLAEGGMGKVYCAKRIQNGKIEKVVIKTAKDNNISTKCLLKEAEINRKLNNKYGIFPRILETGNLQDQTPYIAFEEIEGIELRALMGQRELKLSEILEIALQLCGLSALHDEGLVHRDMKPANVLISNVMRDGEIKYVAHIIDLAFACPINYKDTQSLGTPAYISSEALYRRPVDQRADIYSLGLILFEMIAGYNPMRENAELTQYSNNTILRNQNNKFMPGLDSLDVKDKMGMELLKDYSNDIESGIATIHDILKSTIAKMTHKDPNQRFNNLDGVRKKLHIAAMWVKAVEEAI